MPKPKDRFHQYLDYCDATEIIGVGDFIERFAKSETLAWTQLLRDCMDTYNAGLLTKTKADNGSTAYVRPNCAKLHHRVMAQKASA